jgi:hypothetical protein
VSLEIRHHAMGQSQVTQFVAIARIPSPPRPGRPQTLVNLAFEKVTVLPSHFLGTSSQTQHSRHHARSLLAATVVARSVFHPLRWFHGSVFHPLRRFDGSVFHPLF